MSRVTRPVSPASRRRFLGRAALLAAATPLALTARLHGADAPSNRVRIGAMGTSRNQLGDDGRGTTLAKELASLPGVEIAYVCDVDQRNVGRVIAGRCWYLNDRPSIGRGKATVVPDWLDWPQWQGPAPRAEFRDNVVHYNWHWFWRWGTGEVGNNGVHTLDVVRWGLGIDAPRRVTSNGGRYRYGDDQETPDTNLVTFDCDDRTITWEGRSWGKRAPWSPDNEIAFYGENGMLAIRGGGYRIYEADGREIDKGTGDAGNLGHLSNFVEAIRGNATLNAEIAEGAKSTLFCHLANIAYRTGHTIDYDGRRQQIIDDAAAMKLWSRDYAPGWKPVV